MTLEAIAIVRDTVHPDLMPIDDSYQAVLAYRDGPYRWSTAQAMRYHAAGKLIYPISVLGEDPHLAQVIDCEPGDVTVTEAVDWVRRRNELHHDGTVYADLSTIRSLLHVIGDEPAWLWIAFWRGQPELPAISLPPNVRIAAVQYSGAAIWDLSAIISREWPASPYTDVKDW